MILLYYYMALNHAGVVERQTRCLQAAVPTRREGSNPFLRTNKQIRSRKRLFLYAFKITSKFFSYFYLLLLEFM